MVDFIGQSTGKIFEKFEVALHAYTHSRKKGVCPLPSTGNKHSFFYVPYGTGVRSGTPGSVDLTLCNMLHTCQVAAYHDVHLDLGVHAVNFLTMQCTAQYTVLAYLLPVVVKCPTVN